MSGRYPGRNNGEIDWALIREQLPFEKTPEHRARRDQLWPQIDVNANGLVSLAELDKGLRDVLRCYQIYNCKPAIIRAFTAAKDAVPSSKPHSDYYIDRAEFRLALLYLRQYFEYFQAFSRIDTNDDRRISKKEFLDAVPMMEQWVGPIKNPEATFREVDDNGGGYILFAEFCDWAIRKNLALEEANEE